MKKYSYEANHNKFSILNFLPPLIFWAIKLNIMETASKLAEKVKLKSCLPPLAQANTIIICFLIYQGKRNKTRSLAS